MTGPFHAVMFDLDGTLADTLADITNVGNYMLEKFDLPPMQEDRYRYLAGLGMHYLVSEALGDGNQHLVDQGVELAKAYQMEHGIDLAGPYPGVPQLLDQLIERKLKLAVLSNKQHPATQLVMQKLFSKWSFDAIWGVRPEYEPKPDPSSAKAMASELGIAPKNWLYLGDTDVDMQTATGAGFCAVGVLWGFRDESELRDNGAQHIIKHPSELLDLLQSS